MMSLGSRIRERRESLGMTQLQLGKIIGVTNVAIANYETQTHLPKADVIPKLSIALKCDPNYLFQDEMKILKKEGFTRSKQNRR